jgi:hypothetical protein
VGNAQPETSIVIERKPRVAAVQPAAVSRATAGAPARKPRKLAQAAEPALATNALQLRREALRDGLQRAVDHLKARRADLIGDGFIADYVALDWLEWHGGNLRLTVIGGNVCRQLAYDASDAAST